MSTQNVCSRKSSRIYLAGSWKNADNILALRDLLKAEGHEVDCFASTDTGRTSFNWSELITALGCQERAEAEIKLAGMDAIDLLSFDRVIEAFQEDKKFLDWCDTCILILPSGKSAHLEAGYAKGQGKTLIIFGEFLKGERDVMYGFADGLYRDAELSSMIDRLNHGIFCPDRIPRGELVDLCLNEGAATPYCLIDAEGWENSCPRGFKKGAAHVC